MCRSHQVELSLLSRLSSHKFCPCANILLSSMSVDKMPLLPTQINIKQCHSSAQIPRGPLSTWGQSPYGGHWGPPCSQFCYFTSLCSLWLFWMWSGKRLRKLQHGALALVWCVAGGSSLMSKDTALLHSSLFKISSKEPLFSLVIQNSTSANHTILSLPHLTPFSKALPTCVRPPIVHWHSHYIVSSTMVGVSWFYALLQSNLGYFTVVGTHMYSVFWIISLLLII